MSKKKNDEVKDLEVVPSTPPTKGTVRSDRSIILPTSKSDSEIQDQITESLAGASSCMDIVVPDKRAQVAALTLSDLNPTRDFNKGSPILMVWDNRSNNWAIFRSLDEVAELFSEVEVYVALPQFYKKLKRGFREA